MTDQPIKAPAFSIITPSYNMLRYLPLCCNSISDQSVNCEHIVVDAASIDGTAEWLKSHPNVISVSESDEGISGGAGAGSAPLSGLDCSCDEGAAVADVFDVVDDGYLCVAGEDEVAVHAVYGEVLGNRILGC